MRKMKRLIALMGAALLAALTPASAMAATGGYVPTAGTAYYLDEGQWVVSNSFKTSYKKDGRVTKKISTYPDGDVNTVAYSWKGNLLRKIVSSSNGAAYSTTTKKYKNGLLKSTVTSGVKGTTKETYKWKGKKAAGSLSTTQSNYDVVSMALKVNGKKQIVSYEEKYKDGSSFKIVSAQ